MGTCCRICSSNKENQIDDKTGSNQIKKYSNQTNISLFNQLSPQSNDNNKQLQPNNYLNNNINIINNNTFPRFTKYEEILNKDFIYFNVFWYDPNKTKEFDNFIKCFENVEFNIAYNLDSAMNFFKEKSISEWIVITPGTSGKGLILNLENFKCIKSFFIFSSNVKVHKKWAKNIKKVGCITSSSEELCQKLIEINKNYIIPNFNYKTQENISCYLNEINAELKFDSQISGLKILYVYSKIGEKNELSKFYLKSLNYLNSDEIQKDFKETNNKRNLIFYLGVNFFKNDKNSFHNFLDYLKNLTLLSLYFHNYPYLLNLLSFQEVTEIFEDSIPQLLVR